MRQRATATLLLLLCAGCAVLIATRAFLFGEASELLVITLERGPAYRIEQALVQTRPMMWVPMLPVLALAKVTDRLQPLVFAFGLGHVLVVLLSVVGTLAALKHRPLSEVFIAVAAICLLPLPGQIYVVSGQLMVAQLFWLVLVSLEEAPTSRRALGVVLILAPALLWLHAVVVPMFLGCGAYYLLAAWRYMERRRARLVTAAGLLLAGGVRGALMFVTTDRIRLEDRGHPSLMKLEASFAHPRVSLVVGYFALVLAAMMFAGWWRTRVRALASVMCVAGAGACLLGFIAGNPRALEHGVNYIGWVFPLAVLSQVLYLHVTLAPRAESSRAQSDIGMAAPLVAIGLLFAVGVTAFSLQWQTQIAGARALVAARGAACVEREGLFDATATSLDDEFGYFEYIYLASGPDRRTPKAVLEHGLCQQVCEPVVTLTRPYFILTGDATPNGQPSLGGGAGCPLQHLLE